MMPTWIPATRRLIFLFLFGELAACLVGQTPATGELPPRPERILLTWSGDPATTQAVTWRTAGPVTRARGVLTRASADPRNFRVPAALHEMAAVTTRVTPEENEAPVYYHTAHFTGLEPGTTYAYRVGMDRAWSEWNHFTTASRDPGRFSFIYLGDAQTGLDSLWPRVIRTAFRWAPRARFVLYAGDLINRPLSDRDWKAWFAAGGWIHRVMPCVAAAGNHEYVLPQQDGKIPKRLTPFWQPQFAYPRNGVPGLEDTNYVLDYQGLRLVVLNSNVKIQEQGRWLEEVLAKDRLRWTVASFHHPVYSTARGRENPEIRAMWQPVLEKYGVDLVLQGHDHAYGRKVHQSAGRTVRTRQAGTVYIVSVSGPKMYDLDPAVRKTMQRTGKCTQLFQVITVDQARLEYRCFDAAGRLFDSFTLQKQAGQPARLIEHGRDAVGTVEEKEKPKD
jgi:purple acid phosphatase-like protein/calcineurin-like phosphoesterase family protein